MTEIARVLLKDEQGNARISWYPDATDEVKGIVLLDNELDIESINPVQNKIITTVLNEKSDKNHTHNQYLTAHQDISGKADIEDIPTKLTDLTDDLGNNPVHTHSQYVNKTTEINGHPLNDNVTISAGDLTTGTLDSARLSDSGVTAGTYTLSTVTVDRYGRVTSASNGQSSVSFPYITQQYNSGTSWYRVWSDGFCMQGGEVTAAPSAPNVYLLKTYKDTNYTVIVQSKNHSYSSMGYGGVPQTGSYFKAYCKDSDRLSSWVTFGLIS